jgi:hypothetical protein
MERHNINQIKSIKEMLSIIGYLLYNRGLSWPNKLLGFHQILYFALSYK